MTDYIPSGEDRPEDILEYGATPEIGPVLESLFATIRQRGIDLPDGSYTATLLSGHEDKLLKKIGEEATEVVMAAKSGDADQLRYESADLVYHLLVVMQRWGLTPHDLARELESRFT
ncbi:MAG: phosphoribosyl-ATP diphosphatase [Coriobacteriia bacterium]|nr:phosphoribosyl-ATP diphosphatase [Coriobacteriia bacterium]